MAAIFGEHDAAKARVPEKPVGAAVAAHGDMADGIDPQARLQARRDGEIEKVDVVRHIGKDRREFGGKQLEPHAGRLAQFHDHVLPIGRQRS